MMVCVHVLFDAGNVRMILCIKGKRTFKDPFTCKCLRKISLQISCFLLTQLKEAVPFHSTYLCQRWYLRFVICVMNYLFDWPLHVFVSDVKGMWCLKITLVMDKWFTCRTGSFLIETISCEIIQLTSVGAFA